MGTQGEPLPGGQDILGFFGPLNGGATDPEADRRLAQLLSFPTLAAQAYRTGDWSAFEAQRAWLEAAYPQVFSAASVELVEGAAGGGPQAMLLEIPGSNPQLAPLVLMAHQDVVPCVPGTQDHWTYGPFAGTADGTWIWGRGAIDMKVQLAGIFEALGRVLGSGAPLERGVIVALGHDEECLQEGARALAARLEERGIRPAFLVDEGDYLIHDLASLGGSGHWMGVAIAEKGYADLWLSARSAGGHSSNPAGGTSLGRLCEAVTRVCHEVGQPRLTAPVAAMFRQLAPRISRGPIGELLQGDPARVEACGQALAELLARDPETYPLVCTTAAPTMMEGGSSAPNVLPQDMGAAINFRLLPGDSVAGLVAQVRDLVADLDVQVTLMEGANDPSCVSLEDGWGVDQLRQAAASLFCELDGTPIPLAPTLATGASDARMYESCCDQCLRFSAFVGDEAEIVRGVHGTNERILSAAFAQGVAFLRDLVTGCCCGVPS